MKIECKLLRAGGTEVSIKNTTVKFVPRADGRHVAEVEDENVIGVLLAIEGYAEVDSELEASPPEVLPGEAEAAAAKLKAQFNELDDYELEAAKTEGGADETEGGTDETEEGDESEESAETSPEVTPEITPAVIVPADEVKVVAKPVAKARPKRARPSRAKRK